MASATSVCQWPPSLYCRLISRYSLDTLTWTSQKQPKFNITGGKYPKIGSALQTFVFHWWFYDLHFSPCYTLQNHTHLSPLLVISNWLTKAVLIFHFWLCISRLTVAVLLPNAPHISSKDLICKNHKQKQRGKKKSKEDPKALVSFSPEIFCSRQIPGFILRFWWYE